MLALLLCPPVGTARPQQAGDQLQPGGQLSSETQFASSFYHDCEERDVYFSFCIVFNVPHFFFNVDDLYSLYLMCYNITSVLVVFIFLFLATRYVGSQLPTQGLNSHACSGRWSLIHRTTREVSEVCGILSWWPELTDNTPASVPG